MPTQSSFATPVSATGLLLPVVSTPTRAFNAAFTPNVSRPTQVYYSIEIGKLGGDIGSVELRSDAGAPVTPRDSVRHDVAGGAKNRWVLSFLVPAGWQVSLATTTLSGTPTFTLIHQTEVTV